MKALGGWPVVAVLTGLAAVLRFYGLDDKPLWTGEIQELVSARSARFWAQILDSGTDVFGYMWHHLVWLMGLRPGELVTRIPAAALGAATIPVIYLLGVRLHSRAAGAASAALAALSFFHVCHSQDARALSYLTFFYALSWLAMHEAFFKGSKAWAAVFAVAAGLAGLSHSVGGLYLAVQCMYFVATALFVMSNEAGPGRLGALKRYLVPALFALPLCAVQLYVVADYAFAFKVTPQPVVQQVEAGDVFLVRLLLSWLSGGPAWAQLVMSALAVAGAVSLLRGLDGRFEDRGTGTLVAEHRLAGALLLAWLLVPVGVLYFVSVALGLGRFEIYHLLPVLPAFLLLTGIGLSVAAELLLSLLGHPRVTLRQTPPANPSLREERPTWPAEGPGHGSTPADVSPRWPAEGPGLFLSAGLSLVLAVASNAGALLGWYEQPVRHFQGDDFRSLGGYLAAHPLGEGDVLFLNYSEQMIPMNFYAGEELRKATVVVPWKPKSRHWQHHMLLRAHFQATDSDVVRLLPDEIETTDEFVSGRGAAGGRVLCVLPWVQKSIEHRGLGGQLRWLEGERAGFLRDPLAGRRLPDGFSAIVFPGVTLLEKFAMDKATRVEVASQLRDLLVRSAPPMLSDMAPEVYGRMGTD